VRLLIVVNVDWFFLSHRLPVALGALQDGHEVHIATTLTKGREELEAHGFVVHALHVDRSDAGPAGMLKLLFSLWFLFRRVRPDVLHLVTIKPVLLGGLAARFAPIGGVVYAVSGLGHVFVAQGLLGRARRALVATWYRFALGAANMRIIFQNPDDRAAIESIARVRPAQVVVIPGSGVDLSQYRAQPLPTHNLPVVLMAARLLVTKGVREFVAAARRLREHGVRADFWLVGDPDPANPASIPADELKAWAKHGDVRVFGHRRDMPGLFAQANMVVLPSYREGLPKVLIEAAACGRAVVTTDVPGCRDAIEIGLTGLLVPARDASALAQAIRRLLDDPAACAAMGAAGRRRAEQVFDVRAVVQTHLAIYKELEAQA
jgi:glycosyltransferase involved in cell wall biosynthesis